MINKNCIEDKNFTVSQRVKFFDENSPYFSKLQKSAKDMAAQNIPVLVYSKDVLMRKWFAESLCFEKFQNVNNFVYVPCSVRSGEEIFQVIQNLPSGSCIFLDRIERLSLDFQNGLVDALSNRYFEEKNICVAAGAQENLELLSEQEKFSKSLCFRLNLLKVKIISLNENRSEILTLARFFLETESAECGIPFKGFSESAVSALQKHFWNGEVSELKNVIQRALIFGEPPYISADDLGLETAGSNEVASDIAEKLGEDKSLKTAIDSFKRFYVKKILEENGNNQTKAAKVLGLQRTYVARLLTELNLR